MSHLRGRSPGSSRDRAAPTPHPAWCPPNRASRPTSGHTWARPQLEAQQKNHEKTLLHQWGVAGGETKRTFSVVGRVLDDLLVALELGRDDLVPGDPKLVVDVDGMLRLMRLVDLQTAHDKHLERVACGRRFRT